jgi:FkbM family methyltransferase
MLTHLREAVRDTLPPKFVYAYRVLRHTVIWPTEPEMVTARQFLSREEIAVDVGANVGLFASVLARRSKTVVAFEPNPACVRHLVEVAPRNCEVIAKAVSDRAGTTTLRVPVASGIAMDALSSIEAKNHFDSERRATEFVTHTVETVTLDQILLGPSRTGDRVGFINIDAEGHEFAVLRGGEATLTVHRPVLLVELEYRHGAAVPDVFAWLKERRYAPRALIDGRNLAPIDSEALRLLQDEKRLSRRLAGDRHSGYVNNIFFLPEA